MEHALAKDNNGNPDRGPVLKVSKRANQSIIGLVLHSHGRPRTISADGCSFITRRERDRDIHRLMDKPGSCRLSIVGTVQLGNPGVPIKKVVRWPEMSPRNLR